MRPLDAAVLTFFTMMTGIGWGLLLAVYINRRQRRRPKRMYRAFYTNEKRPPARQMVLVRSGRAGRYPLDDADSVYASENAVEFKRERDLREFMRKFVVKSDDDPRRPYRMDDFTLERVKTR